MTRQAPCIAVVPLFTIDVPEPATRRKTDFCSHPPVQVEATRASRQSCAAASSQERVEQRRRLTIHPRASARPEPTLQPLGARRFPAASARSQSAFRPSNARHTRPAAHRPAARAQRHASPQRVATSARRRSLATAAGDTTVGCGPAEVELVTALPGSQQISRQESKSVRRQETPMPYVTEAALPAHRETAP